MSTDGPQFSTTSRRLILGASEKTTGAVVVVSQEEYSPSGNSFYVDGRTLFSSENLSPEILHTVLQYVREGRYDEAMTYLSQLEGEGPSKLHGHLVVVRGHVWQLAGLGLLKLLYARTHLRNLPDSEIPGSLPSWFAHLDRSVAAGMFLDDAVGELEEPLQKTLKSLFASGRGYSDFLISISGKRDFGKNLYRVGSQESRLGEKGELVAALLWGFLSKEGTSLGVKPYFQQKADQELQAMLGTGDAKWGTSAEWSLRRVVHTATDAKLIATFMGASVLGGYTQLRMLRYLKGLPEGMFTRGVAARFVAGGAGLGSEILGFTTVGLGERLASGEVLGFGKIAETLFVNSVVLGSLRVWNYMGTSAYASLHGLRAGVAPRLEGLMGITSRAMPFMGGVGGLYMGYAGLESLGYRPQSGPLTRFTSALSMQGAFSMGGHLGGTALGPGFARYMGNLKREIRYHESFLDHPQLYGALEALWRSPKTPGEPPRLVPAGVPQGFAMEQRPDVPRPLYFEGTLFGEGEGHGFNPLSRALPPMGIVPKSEQTFLGDQPSPRLGTADSQVSKAQVEAKHLVGQLRKLLGFDYPRLVPAERVGKIRTLIRFAHRILSDLAGDYLPSERPYRRTFLEHFSAQDGQNLHHFLRLVSEHGSLGPQLQSEASKMGEIQDRLLYLGRMPRATDLSAWFQGEHGNVFVPRTLANFGVTQHTLDVRAFREGFHLARENPALVRNTAWDVDEVILHWAMNTRDAFRGSRGKDALYYNTPASVFNYEPFVYEGSPSWYVRLLSNRRLRHHIQFHPGVRAFQLGLRLGLGENLTLCTTGPTGRVLTLVGEDPAMKFIYFGKGRDEVVSSGEFREAENVYTREHLALAMREARGIRYLAEEENSLVVDYIRTVKKHPKKGAKLKHPAIPHLLARAGITKRPFDHLVDDSGSTYKMLAQKEGFTLFKPPSKRKQFRLWPFAILNFTFEKPSKYQQRMSNAYVLALSAAMRTQPDQSVELPEVVSETGQATELPDVMLYPHQRFALEIPWWRQDREFFGPMKELKSSARVIVGNHLPEAFANTYFWIRHGESFTNTGNIVVGSLREGKKSKFGLTENGKQQVRDNTESWYELNREAVGQAVVQGKLHIYSSPFSRAWQSAEMVARVISEKTGKRITVRKIKDLRERSFGTLELSRDASTLYPRVWELDEVDPTHTENGAESAQSVQRRASSVMTRLEHKYSEGGHLFLLVSHGDIIRIGQVGVADQSPTTHRSVGPVGNAEFRNFLRPGQDTIFYESLEP